MAAFSNNQNPEVHFLPPHRNAQFLRAESRRLRAASYRLRLESLTIQCDFILSIAAVGDANRDDQRTRRLCCAKALKGYRSIWRMLARERTMEVQPSDLLAKLDELRTALINLLGDEAWPTNEVPGMVPTIPASLPIRTTPKGLREYPFEALTRRESEVLKCIAEGNSTKQVAAMLGITFKTASCHLYRLMEKLDIHDRASLVRYAIRNEIIKA